MIQSSFLHQVVRRRPVAMAIEQCADNSAAQHPRECFLISFRIESRDDFIALRKAANVQTLFIRRPAAETGHLRRVDFLETLFIHICSVSLLPLGEGSARNCSRNLNLCTLPVAVYGSSSTKM